MGMPGQADGLRLGHGAGVDEHGHPAGGLLDHGLGHQLPLLRGHEIHLTGGTTGIQALHPFLNEELGLFLQGGHIHFSILGEGGGHGRDDSKQFFHQITS